MTTNEEKLASYLYFKNPDKFCKDLEERSIIDKSTTTYILKTLAAPEGMLFAIILSNTLVEYEDTFNIEHFLSYRYFKAAREGKRIDGIMAGLRYYTPGFFTTTVEEAKNHIEMVHEKKIKGINIDKYESIQNRIYNAILMNSYMEHALKNDFKILEQLTAELEENNTLSVALSKYVKVNDSKGLKSVLKITKEAINLKKIKQKYDIYNYKDLNYAKLRSFANYSLVNVRRVCRVIDYSNAAKYLEYFNHGQVRETFPSSIMKREIFMNENKGKEILETVIKSQKEILDYIEKVLEENNLSIAYHFYRILVGKALIDRNKHPYCRFANDSILEIETKYGAKPIRGLEINKIIEDIRKDLTQIKILADDNVKRLLA